MSNELEAACRAEPRYRLRPDRGLGRGRVRAAAMGLTGAVMSPATDGSSDQVEQ